MAHLLIDTVKTDAGKKYLPFGRHDVRLFADKKTARPFRKLAASADGTCPECGGNAALHLIIPPKDKFTRTILKTVKAILSGHPEAKIAVISPREKLQKSWSVCSKNIRRRRFSAVPNWAKKSAVFCITTRGRLKGRLKTRRSRFPPKKKTN